MKYLPFKIILICIIFPPVFYLSTVYYLERYLEADFSRKIENIYTGDTEELFEGNISLKDAINNNIDNFLHNNPLVVWGIKPDVTVITRTGTILYPSFEDEDSLLPTVQKQVASENYKLMNDGLTIQINLSLTLDSPLTISIFSFYLSISILSLYYFYRMGALKAKQESRYNKQEIYRLRELEIENNSRMEILTKEKMLLSDEFKRIKISLEMNLRKNKDNEDGMIDEIIALEKKITDIHTLYDEENKANKALRDIISQYETGVLKTKKQQVKDSQLIHKRFKVLYKHIYFHQRAIYGFCNMSEEMQLKTEEIIHNLKFAPELIKVKRKIGNKKNNKAIFEIAFSYTARLYYSKDAGEKITILVIGTKNTQNKDIAFLNTV